MPGGQGTHGVPKEPGGQVEAWVRVRRRRRRGWRGKEFMVSYAGGGWGDFGGSRARRGGEARRLRRVREVAWEVAWEVILVAMVWDGISASRRRMRTTINAHPPNHHRCV